MEESASLDDAGEEMKNLCWAVFLGRSKGTLGSLLWIWDGDNKSLCIQVAICGWI